MKVLLAGSTGFIGSEILTQLLSKPDITQVLLISRRPLPGVSARYPRIAVFVLDSFLQYPDELLAQLSEVKVCLWALGGSNKNQTPSEKMDEVEVQYPLALAHACILANRGNEGWKMRFLFISGTLSEPDQGKKLWFLGDGRKARGLAETKLLDLANMNVSFEAVIIQAAYVLPKMSESCVPEFVVALSRKAIRVDELAATMVDVGLHRDGSGRIGNGDLRRRGREVLRGGG